MNQKELGKPITTSQANHLIALLESVVPSIVEQSIPSVMTIKEAAERWDLNEENVRRLCTTGQIKAFKVGTLWRIPRIENEQPSNQDN